MKSKRGPKPRTVSNASRTHPGLIRRPSTESPSPLGEDARAEYERLIGVLEGKGTLERVNLMAVANAARIKVLLDAAHKSVEIDPDVITHVTTLTNVHRGLLRELGLTLQPSRSVIQVKAGQSQSESDPIAGMIKLA